MRSASRFCFVVRCDERRPEQSLISCVSYFKVADASIQGPTNFSMNGGFYIKLGDPRSLHMTIQRHDNHAVYAATDASFLVISNTLFARFA
jgi:hypothetical protein